MTGTLPGGQPTTYTTAAPELVPLAPGGLSESDKIALGVGIGIGLPAALAGIAACIMMAGRG